MSNNTAPKDFRTRAFVLRRTNYGEADRILNLITPTGKISAIAKGVRREKSKLAGGVEMFCLLDLNLHRGNGDLHIVTGAKMLEYFNNIVTDFSKLEFASAVLKKIGSLSEQSENPVFFSLAEQVLRSLQRGISHELIESWFLLNCLRASGEEVNLFFDTSGNKLSADQSYSWDINDKALSPSPNGQIAKNEIKFLRLILSSNLDFVSRVQDFERFLPTTLYVARSLNQL